MCIFSPSRLISKGPGALFLVYCSLSSSPPSEMAVWVLQVPPTYPALRYIHTLSYWPGVLESPGTHHLGPLFREKGSKKWQLGSTECASSIRTVFVQHTPRDMRMVSSSKTISSNARPSCMAYAIIEKKNIQQLLIESAAGASQRTDNCFSQQQTVLM